MNVRFHLKGSTVSSSDREYEMDGGAMEPLTIVRLMEYRGESDLTFVVGRTDAAEMLAIGDAIRAAAQKHLPAPEPVPMEV